MTTSLTETKTTELIKEANQLYDIIKNEMYNATHNIHAYNIRDLLRLNLVEQELARWGYQIKQSSKLAFERVK